MMYPKITKHTKLAWAEVVTLLKRAREQSVNDSENFL